MDFSPMRSSIKNSRDSRSQTLQSTDTVRKSHRKTVHMIAILDCGGTSLLVMVLICTFLKSTIELFELDKRGKPKDDIDFFAYVAIAVKVVLIICVTLNICICVQLMHHTKPWNEKLDVLKRAEFWKNYNIILTIILPFQVVATFAVAPKDYYSGSIALVIFAFRIAYLVIVCCYIKELRQDLATVRSVSFANIDNNPEHSIEQKQSRKLFPGSFSSVNSYDEYE